MAARAKGLTATQRKLAARTGGIEAAELLTDALRAVLLALVPLEFNERREVLRWAHEHYSIDPTKNVIYYPEPRA